MSARSIFRALWRQRWVALLLFVVTVASTAFLLSQAPRVYQATASVGILPAGDDVGFGEIIGPLLPTLADVVRGSDLLAAARRDVPGAPPLAVLRGNVSASAVTDTLVLRISVEDEDPVRAALLANAIAETLPRFNLLADRVTVRTVDAATVPVSPISPQVRLVLGLGLVLGAGLATAGALLVDGARRRYEDVEELVQATGAPMLAQVPRPRHSNDMVDHRSDPITAAAFRSLRISLEVAASSAPLPTVVIAGITPDESNGWLAANTALGLAQVQDRVLFVRADAASVGPDLSALPETDDVPDDERQRDGHPGLADLLRGADLASVLQPGLLPSLTVLETGTDTADLPALLETQFGAMVRRLVKEFDVVVVEAPPVTTSDDARIMGVGGGLVLSARLGRVTPRQVRDAMTSLRLVQSRVVGCVAVTDDAPSSRRRSRR